jgi:lipopolysaccharide/colanic/teichoic acid biosynthesis glycosyltransferase
MKRLFDLAMAILGLLLLAPLFATVACGIKLDSPGPVFFRQVRLGRYGRPFRIFKFRTMAANAEAGGQITIGRDGRITRFGHALRKFKIDELPQLLNVVIGDMSLVGPRPEVPYYCEKYSEETRRIIFSVRPGMTDKASIEYRNESALLGAAADPEKVYVEEILPIKLRYYVEYVETRSLRRDIGIIIETLRAVWR